MTDIVREIVREVEQEAKEKGLEEGLQKGLQKGRQEGELLKALEVARNLIRLGDSVDKVAQATGLSVGEIRKLVQ